jgi:threonine dehydrogenase-like Zn-dependent dehydrogenase
MDALIVTANHTLELQDIRPPQPGPFEALVKIMACGICSTTDPELIRGTQPFHDQYPCVLGHEAIGEVIDVGSKVTSFKMGDWVTRPVAIWPDTSSEGLASAWGGYAEFGIVRDQQAMAAAGDHSVDDNYTALRQNVLPQSIGIKAAVLSIALAETLSCSRHLDLVGRSVCIAGTGVAGLSLILWSKLAGAKRIIVLGRRSERLQLAKELGADDCINVREQSPVEGIRELCAGGVDCFIEASGAIEQLQVAARSICNGGTVAVYGIAPDGHYDLDWTWLPTDIRIVQPPVEEHLARAEVVKLIIEGKIPVARFMTHSWPLAQFKEAFGAIHNGSVVKSMLTMA